MNNLKLIFKEILQSKFQVIMLVLCLTLSIGIFISIDSLRLNVENFIDSDSKILAGGDIIINSNRMFSKNLSNSIKLINKTYPNLDFVNSYSFTSMIYSPKNDKSLLSEIRIISNKYPLYGTIKLKYAKNISTELTTGNIIVQPELLIRLNLSVGDILKIGDKKFKIKDVILNEPDKPLNLFNLGPRVFISEIDINELNLIGNKSRIHYKILIKTLNDVQSNQIISLINKSKLNRETVKLYSNVNNSLKSFSLNFLLFLKLISLFIIFITGIGITSIIFSYLDEKKLSIGIRKSLGDKNKNIIIYYYKTIFIISIISTIFAIIFALILTSIFPILFENILPSKIIISLSLVVILKGILISIIITSIFTFYPLFSLNKILPLQIFRNETNNLFKKDKLFYLISLISLIFFIIFVFEEIRNFYISIYLVIGSVLFFYILYFLVNFFLYLIKKYKYLIKNLELRQSINGFFRIGNKTILIITSITLSLSIIFTISFIEINLQNQFITSFPEDAPNIFIIDIPKDNLTQIQEIIKNKSVFYPMIRGFIVTINGVDVKQIEAKSPSREDSLTRTFSLTYGNLLEGEKIIKSENLGKIFVNNWSKKIVQVSVLDSIAQRMNVEIGDNLLFSIQGVEINAEVVSIRTRESQNIGAFFYFTFQKKVLVDAPQTIFTISKVDSLRIPIIQNEIIKKFPQVTVINAQSTAKSIGNIISQLSSIVSFFTLFSLFVGILILISSVISTNEKRIQEAVFYKLVGANKLFLRKVFIFEYLIIGVICSVFALFLSTIITYLITIYFLKINFIFLTKFIFLYFIITIFTITFIGYLSLINIFRKKPIEFIRENKMD